MHFSELLSGLLIGGVGGYLAKGKLSSSDSQLSEKQHEIDSLCIETEKLSKRNKELERQVEDLLSEITKIRKQAKQNDDDQDDLEDEVLRLKREIADMRTQNLDLTRKMKEYKSACESLEAELSLMKRKND